MKVVKFEKPNSANKIAVEKKIFSEEKNISEEEKILLRNAEEWVKRVKRENSKIGSGKRADIITGLPRFDEKNAIIGYVCLKENVRTTKTSSLENDLEEEASLQVIARQILEEAKDRKVAYVPEVVAHIAGAGEEYLAMQSIKGKTIWRLAMEAALEVESSAIEEVKGHIKTNYSIPPSKASDKEMENAFVAVMGERGALKEILKLARQNPFLTKKQHQKVANTVRVFNENGFWHRDLHTQNIMLDNKGEVVIIDFGTAHYDPLAGRNKLNPYDMGNDFVAAKDDGVITELSPFVKISQEEFKQKRREKDKRDENSGLEMLKSKLKIEITEENFERLYDRKNGGKPAINLYLELYSLTNSKNYNNILLLAKALCSLEKRFFSSINKTREYLENNFLSLLKNRADNLRFKQAILDKLPKS